MQINSTIKRRFLATPTIMDSWSAEFGDEVVEAVSEEYREELVDELEESKDSTSGLESLYSTVLYLTTPPDESVSISGLEGLGGAISRGVEKVVQWIKDFFKAIWNFFTGAKQRKEVKDLKEASRKLESGEVGFKEGKDISFPGTFSSMYLGTAKPPEDMRWVNEAFDRYLAGKKVIIEYLRKTNAKVATFISRGEVPDSELKEEFTSFLDEAAANLVKNKDIIPGSTIEKNDNGRYYFRPKSGVESYNKPFNIKADSKVCKRIMDHFKTNLVASTVLKEMLAIEVYVTALVKSKAGQALGKIVKDFLRFVKTAATAITNAANFLIKFANIIVVRAIDRLD